MAAAYACCMHADKLSGTQAEITLFEASSRLGGNFGTERVGEYLIERGADSFITNKPGAVRLCLSLRIEDRLISTNAEFRRSLILKNGTPVPTPDGFNLLAPGKVWPMLTTPLLSWAGKLRMAGDYFIKANKGGEDESLASFVRRRFGNEVLERIVQPMVGGIYTSDPERLSLKATLPRFVEMERQHGSLIRGLRATNKSSRQQEDSSGARYGLFATPQNGMSELLTALEEQLRNRVNLRTSCKVTSLHQRGENYVVTCNDKQEEFDFVILTVPAFVVADLVRSFQPELAAALEQIEYASSAIVVSGHDLSEIDHPLNAFGLVIPHIEQRQILAVSFLSRKFAARAPQGKVILRTFVGGAMQPEQFDKTDAEIQAVVQKELREILGVRGEPEFSIVARYARAMPQYTVGHLERVAKIREFESQLPRIAIAGNAYDGVGIPDCIESGERAAGSAWESLFSQ